MCAYLQEAAGLHAARLGVSMERLAEEGVAWVLRRLRVELERPVMLHEELLVLTWPSGFERVMAAREFVLTVDGERVGVATSRWVVLDLVSRRVVRIPPFIRELRPEEPGSVLELGPDATGGSGEESPDRGPVQQFDVRLGDLDVVDHVNNTRFVEWACEAAGESLWRRGWVRTLDVTFLGEARYGDRIEVAGAAAENEASSRRSHHLRRAGDGRDLARVMTDWRLEPDA